MSKNPGGTIHERTHYDVLGISEAAGTDEIRSAWRALISDLHPDRVADEGEKEKLNDQAAEVNAAYSTLKDAETRSRYDAELAYERGAEGEGEPRDRSADYSDAYSPHSGEHDGYEGTQGYGNYEDEPDWDRMQAEAEAEAAQAWERWENPGIGDRVQQAWSEIKTGDLPSTGGIPIVSDYLSATSDFEQGRPREGGMWLTLTGINVFMVLLTAGGLVLLAVPFSGLLWILAAAFAVDLVLNGLGARPMRYMALQAGSGARLTEGQKMMSLICFVPRAMWFGFLMLMVIGTGFLIFRWIYHLFYDESAIEPFIGYGLAAFPVIWTLIFVGVWMYRASRRDAERQDTADAWQSEESG